MTSSDAPSGRGGHRRRRVVERRAGWGEQEVARCVGASLVARPFCRIDLEAGPDAATLRRRRGCRVRAGIASRIGVSPRCCGLDRCRDHGADGLGRRLGWRSGAATLESTRSISFC